MKFTLPALLLFALIFFCPLQQYGQTDAKNHCCSIRTGECVETDTDCSMSGAIFSQFGKGGCTPNPCGKCCTANGCVTAANSAACVALGFGAHWLGSGASAECDECDRDLGTCCHYANKKLVRTQRNVPITQCTALSGQFAHFMLSLTAACPPDEPQRPNSVQISELVANYSNATRAVQLTWQVDLKKKSEGFYIERSKDGVNFKKIGFVDANETVPGSGRYAFSDINPFETGYYRLLGVFEDGILMNSKTIMAVGIKPGKLVLVPNPVSNKVQVLLNNIQLYTTEVQVTDMTGRLFLKQTISEGDRTDINTSSLPKGVYIVRVLQNGRVYTAKMIRN